MTGRHKAAVIDRAGRHPTGLVYPANWQERRALARMTARGEMRPAPGMPGVWQRMERR